MLSEPRSLVHTRLPFHNHTLARSYFTSLLPSLAPWPPPLLLRSITRLLASSLPGSFAPCFNRVVPHLPIPCPSLPRSLATHIAPRSLAGSRCSFLPSFAGSLAPSPPLSQRLSTARSPSSPPAIYRTHTHTTSNLLPCSLRHVTIPLPCSLRHSVTNSSAPSAPSVYLFLINMIIYNGDSIIARYRMQ